MNISNDTAVRAEKQERDVGFRSASEQGGFTQIPNVILTDNRVSPGAHHLYALFRMYAWQEGHCFPGEMRLALELGVSERTVRRWIRTLEEAKLITTVQRGLGRTNRYLIEPLSSHDRTPVSGLDRTPVSGLLKEEEDSVEEDSVKTLTREKSRAPKSSVDKHPNTHPKSHPSRTKGANGAPTATRHPASPKSHPQELPAGWVPAEAARAWTELNGAGLDLAGELEMFRNYAEATGAKRRDWPAAWRFWIRKAARAEPQRVGDNQPARQEPRSLVPWFVDTYKRQGLTEGEKRARGQELAAFEKVAIGVPS